MKNYHDKRFPNESEAYRVARNELLEAEMDLGRQTEGLLLCGEVCLMMVN